MADDIDEDGHGHIPVMTAEVMDWLAPRAGETVVDGTVGLAGHARLFAEAVGPAGLLICFDRDGEALMRAERNLAAFACGKRFINARYEFALEEVRKLGINRIDRALLDIGVSSLQLDSPERGFSFMRDGPLDMRMDRRAPLSAGTVVNDWPEEELERIFREYGEERFSRRYARTIAERRSERPIHTTGELAAAIADVSPGRGRIHPATRVFQALRMAVNDELGTLSRGLAAMGKLLRPGGRLAVVTFHSLEDRLVKRTFLSWRERGLAEPCHKKAVLCRRDEAERNRRARSAKLRTVERLEGIS